MTSQIWVKGYKLSAVIGTVFGLLLPGLPLLATPSDIVEKSSSATSGDLLIAQTLTPCLEGDREYDSFRTQNREISICQTPSKEWYIGLLDSNGEDTYHFVNDVKLFDDGSYRATDINDDGNEYIYYVGVNEFRIVHDDQILTIEEYID